jgi:hypothetical protein
MLAAGLWLPVGLGRGLRLWLRRVLGLGLGLGVLGLGVLGLGLGVGVLGLELLGLALGLGLAAGLAGRSAVLAQAVGLAVLVGLVVVGLVVVGLVVAVGLWQPARPALATGLRQSAGAVRRWVRVGGGAVQLVAAACG